MNTLFWQLSINHNIDLLYTNWDLIRLLKRCEINYNSQAILSRGKSIKCHVSIFSKSYHSVSDPYWLVAFTFKTVHKILQICFMDCFQSSRLLHLVSSIERHFNKNHYPEILSMTIWILLSLIVILYIYKYWCVLPLFFRVLDLPYGFITQSSKHKCHAAHTCI